jgi:hypothetical protein
MIERSLEWKYDDSNFQAHPNSVLFFKASKMTNPHVEVLRPLISVVSIASLAGPVIAVKSDVTDESDLSPYIFLKSRTDWVSVLAVVMKDGLTRKKIL